MPHKYPEQRALLDTLFTAAVVAADPARCVPPWLPPPPRGRTVVVGAGKAAAAMARAVEDHWQGAPERLSGCVVTRYGYGMACRRIEVVEAAHPVPDAASHAAARRILHLVDGLTEDDLVLALISGGASSLLAVPAAGISLADKQDVTRQLLASGAPIREINCVRKHLSAIKGGRLALAAWPARMVTLAISDVPGDDLSAIGSGPTVADNSTCDDALAILDRYAIDSPVAVRALLLRGDSETPKAGDGRFTHGKTHVVAGGQAALRAAAAAARAAGVTPLILGDAIEGEAREAARVLGGIALSCLEYGEPVGAPCVLLAGGETTVTVCGKGRGGRNGEFLLALAQFVAGHPGLRGHLHAIAGDTDGIDGGGDNAGALIGPDTAERAQALGLDMRALLDANDAYQFFARLDDLVITGPTRTNVNDFRAILIERRA